MTIMSCNTTSAHHNHNSNANANANAAGQFGDTTLTKVFVGGLAWETPKEALREHFDKYGDILEAVIISDKISGRSKGYGFVTFKEAEAAKKACEDAAPVINGRRANCNLASLGARRPRSSVPTPSTTPPPPPPPPPQMTPHHHMIHHHHHGSNGGARSTVAAANQYHQVMQWYYPAGSPAQPAYPHHQHQAVPYYGYTPTYVAADMSYNNQKLSYGGAYMNVGQYGQVYGQHQQQQHVMQPMMYPLYHFHHHQSQAMGLPAQIYTPTAAAGSIPAIISKPGSMVAPPPMSGGGGGGTVGAVESYNKAC